MDKYIGQNEARMIADVFAQRLLSESGAMTAYLIGSLACGNFIEGRSDVDILLIGDTCETKVWEFYVEYKLGEIIEHNQRKPSDLVISACLRPYRILSNPYKWYKELATAQEISWKEFGVMEDLLMLVSHGEFLCGDHVKNNFKYPDSNELRYYYMLRMNCIKCNCVIQEDDELSLNIAKDIVCHAKSCFYLWTGEYLHNNKQFINAVEEKMPGFPGLDIVKKMIDICGKNNVRLYMMEIKDDNNKNDLLADRKHFFSLTASHDKSNFEHTTPLYDYPHITPNDPLDSKLTISIFKEDVLNESGK